MKSSILCIISMIVIQFVLRLLDISETSTKIEVTLLITIGILFAFIMIKNRKKNNHIGIKLSVSVGIIMFIACVLNSIMLIWIRCYPQQAKEYDSLTTIIIFSAIGSFFVLVISFIVAAAIAAENK
ncbi:MAG: hypothetical protein Q8936_23145 [Bacillota bacterium]|nr:hypothetical protein [Bacillota bacterium]